MILDLDKLTPGQRHLVEATNAGSRRIRESYRRNEGLRVMIEGEAPDLGEAGSAMEGLVVKRGKNAVDFSAPSFSWGRMLEAIDDMVAAGEIREATSSGAVSQLLRPDTQRIMDNWMRVKIQDWAYLKVCAPVNSNKAFEIYNPLHGSKVQRRKADGAPFNRTPIVGEEIPLRNETFSGGEEFTAELFQDDQTSQIRERQQYLAVAALQTLEIYFALRFFGAGGTYDILTVPASNWQNLRTSVNSNKSPLASVFTTESATGLGNRVATYTQLAEPVLKEAFDLAARIKDLQGNIVATNPDTLLYSTKDRQIVRRLLNSTYSPNVPGYGTDAPGLPTAGSFTGAFADNVWKGAMKEAMCSYLAAWAWAIGEGGTGMVFQMRQPNMIDQEIPNAGQSFENWEFRLRSIQRFAMDWTQPRKWIAGNDGSNPGHF